MEGRGRVEVDRVAKIMALGTMLYTKVGTSRQRIKPRHACPATVAEAGEEAVVEAEAELAAALELGLRAATAPEVTPAKGGYGAGKAASDGMLPWLNPWRDNTPLGTPATSGNPTPRATGGMGPGGGVAIPGGLVRSRATTPASSAASRAETPAASGGRKPPLDAGARPALADSVDLVPRAATQAAAGGEAKAVKSILGGRIGQRARRMSVTMAAPVSPASSSSSVAP